MTSINTNKLRNIKKINSSIKVYYFLIKASIQKHQSCSSSCYGAFLRWHIKSFVIWGHWDQTFWCCRLFLVWKTSGTSSHFGFSSLGTIFSLVVNTCIKRSIIVNLQYFQFHLELFFLYYKKQDTIKMSWNVKGNSHLYLTLRLTGFWQRQRMYAACPSLPLWNGRK